MEGRSTGGPRLSLCSTAVKGYHNHNSHEEKYLTVAGSCLDILFIVMAESGHGSRQTDMVLER